MCYKYTSEIDDRMAACYLFDPEGKTESWDHYLTMSVWLSTSEHTFHQSIREWVGAHKEHFVKVNYSPLEFLYPLKYLQMGK